MTYRDLYEAGKRQLDSAGVAEAALDARLLLEYVCHTGRNDLLVHGEQPVEEAREKEYRSLIERRAQRIPLQQLTGEQEFMGLTFLVDEHVLIPRQDTEVLVEEVMKELHDGFRILDLCTGSGCILLSLLHYSNGCSGVGTDLMHDALDIARKNAERLGEENAVFVQGDLFSGVEGRFEIIVSNPPYIPTDVIPTLMDEVRLHEPLTALDGGADGLDFYRRIAREAKAHLCGGGQLFLEIGYDQGEAVTRLLEKEGYRDISCTQDFAGLDRVVCGTLYTAELS
ncbi:MAG: peptide chain release factor N(5)-glutamine methyltransferase [Eubacteriales bacterium]|nr:peptide chain release factor N(5)-glutamine methyltransferase [Eubacteriales bacterium]